MKLQWSDQEQELLSETVQPTNQLLTGLTQSPSFFSQLKTTIIEQGNSTSTKTDKSNESSLESAIAPASRSQGEDTIKLSDPREDNVQLTTAQSAETAQANDIGLEISGFQFIEGDSGKDTDFIFAAHLDQAPSQPVTVDFRTVDGTATAGEDYIATSGTLRFEAGLEGLLVERIEVEVLGDNIDESNETFRVELSNPSNGLTLNTSTVTGTIVDDEGSFQPIQNEPEGPVTSQGDSALKADEARSNFNIDGSGIKIGVLSDSYNNLNGASEGVANGELPGPGNPANTTPVEVLADLRSGGTDEGRAMMELIHDVAPGADLAFHTAVNSRDTFVEGINELVEADVDIIVDDIGFRNEPFFQDGLVAQAAQEAVSQGIPFFSSAGNTGRQSYESEFRVGNNVDIPQTNSSEYIFHDFDPSSEVDSLQEFTLEANQRINLSFQWDEPFASVGPVGSSNDLDMFLLNESGESLVTQSTDSNAGSDPIERLQFQNSTSTSQTYNLAIGRFEPEGGSNPGLIKYINFGNEMENLAFDTDSSTVFGHPNAEGVAGVGATFFQNTPEFGTTPPEVEPFSSKGGTPILFDSEGNRLSDPEIRDQPRFTAPNGTNTSFFGNDIPEDSDSFPNFFGTSAAAPHAAAVAALMLEAADGPGSLSPEQISQILENTAINIGEEGFNFKSGFGLIQADQAVEAIINENQSPVAVADNFTTEEGTAFTTGNVLNNDSDPENDSLSITAIDTTNTLGTVTNNEDGTFDYNPNGQFEDLNQGETETDTFSYTVSDEDGNSDTATVTITIEGINEQTSIAISPATLEATEGKPIFNLNLSDSNNGFPFNNRTATDPVQNDNPENQPDTVSGSTGVLNDEGNLIGPLLTSGDITNGIGFDNSSSKVAATQIPVSRFSFNEGEETDIPETELILKGEESTGSPSQFLETNATATPALFPGIETMLEGQDGSI